jgi:hypothetical protein
MDNVFKLHGLPKVIVTDRDYLYKLNLAVYAEEYEGRIASLLSLPPPN